MVIATAVLETFEHRRAGNRLNSEPIRRPDRSVRQQSMPIGRSNMIGLILVALIGWPSTVGAVHDEIRSVDYFLRPFWPEDQLAGAEWNENSRRLLFGRLDLLDLLTTTLNDSLCSELLANALQRYADAAENVHGRNLSYLTDDQLTDLGLLNVWGADEHRALWTLDHWNWVSNDMQCKLLRFPSPNSAPLPTQYCAYELLTDNINQSLTTAYCLPEICRPDEAEAIGQRLTSLLRFDHSVNYTKNFFCSLSYQPIGWYQRPQSIVLVVVIVLLIASVVTASVLHFLMTRNDRLRRSTPAEIFCRIFSAQQHLRKLSEVSKNSVQSMNGLKALTMLLMILCHVYLLKQAFIVDLSAVRERYRTHFGWQILYNGTYAVGSFFLISGALQMYVVLTRLSQESASKVTFWLCAVVVRYLRLVPLLMFCLALITELFPYFNFPVWPYIDATLQCPSQYWRQLLFVQNLQHVNLCATWTWYLAVDFQLFLLNLPLVFLLVRRPRIGLPLLAVCVVLFSGLKAWQVLANDYPPNLMLFVPIADYDENFSRYSFDVYMRPQGWWGAYLVGVAVGYALCKCDRRRLAELSSPTVLFSSLGAMMLLLWTAFGVFWPANGYKSAVYDAVYTGLYPVAWAGAWGWLVLMCERTPKMAWLNGFLRNRFFHFLSNLTYACYLTHLLLVFGLIFKYSQYLGGRPRVRLSGLEIFCLFITSVVVSYLFALLLYLMVEGPAAVLLQMSVKSFTNLRRGGQRSLSVEKAGGDSSSSSKSGQFRKRAHFSESNAREMDEYASASLMRPIADLASNKDAR